VVSKYQSQLDGGGQHLTTSTRLATGHRLNSATLIGMQESAPKALYHAQEAPPLYCVKGSVIRPGYAGDVQESVDSWVEQYAAADRAERVKLTRSGELAAYMALTDVRTAAVDSLARCIAWSFWVDDELADEIDAVTSEQLAAIAFLMDQMDGTYVESPPHNCRAISLALTDLKQTIRASLSEFMYALWISEMKLWLQSLITQNALRPILRQTTEATYLSIRAYAGCTYPSVVIADATSTRVVDETLYRTGQYRQLRRIASLVTLLNNDIISYPAESAEFDSAFNIVVMRLTHYRVDSPYSVMDTVSSTVRDMLLRLLSLRAHLPDAPQINSLLRWIDATLVVQLNSPERYSGWSKLSDLRLVPILSM
jgi:hypothetical protein